MSFLLFYEKKLKRSKELKELKELKKFLYFAALKIYPYQKI